jgi:glycosyltransferase involved in cell wall biosynthesis
MKKPVIYLVLPCYNEEAILKSTIKELNKKISKLIAGNKISNKSRLIFVDDGSRDNTWEIIAASNKKHTHIIGLKLSRNRGHQNALIAGLLYAKDYADAVISMDADLQDDIHAIDEFINQFNKGFEVVYGVRSSRTTDTAFKRGTAEAFYKIMLRLGVDIVYNHADYRLMSSRALQELANYNEVNLFLRGIIPLIGLKSTTVEYARNERTAGESKYPLKKMLAFAFDGITSFSVKPIRLILTVGLIVFIASLVFLAYIIAQSLLGNTVAGWSFIACSLWILGGIQMMSIGLIGEYIGKIYAETKSRPRYMIEKIVE